MMKRTSRILGKGDETASQLAWLLGILLLALLVRLQGITVMLPHPDARLAVTRGFQYLTGDFNPGWFGWPGQTIMWMLAGIYGLYFVAGLALGWFSNFAEFRHLFETDPQSFYVLGRFIMVAFALGCVVMVYKLARRLTDPHYALAAAFFLAISWLHQMHSQFVRPDIVSMFFTLACIHFSLRIREEGSARTYIYAGLALGAAVATKWVMAPVLFAPLLAHLLRAHEGGEFTTSRDRPLRAPWVLGLLGGAAVIFGALVLHPASVQWAVTKVLSPDGDINPGTLDLAGKLRVLSIAGGAGLILLSLMCKPLPILGMIFSTILSKRLLLGTFLTSALLFLLVAPYALIDAPTLVHDLLFEARTEQLGAESFSLPANILWYFVEPLGWGYSHILVVFAIIGLILSYSRSDLKILVILLLFPLLYFAVISNASLRWSRWAIHLLPFAAVLSGVGLGKLVGILRKMSGLEWRQTRWLVPVICILVGLAPLWRIARYGDLMRSEDTRTQAVGWITEELPEGARIAQDALAGDLPPGRFEVYRDLAHPSLSARSLDAYLDEGWEYFVASGDMYSRYYNEPERYADRIEFYERLKRDGQLLKKFEPAPGHWPAPGERLERFHIHHSPEILVYRLPQTTEQEAASAS